MTNVPSKGHIEVAGSFFPATPGNTLPWRVTVRYGSGSNIPVSSPVNYDGSMVGLLLIYLFHLPTTRVQRTHQASFVEPNESSDGCDFPN